MVLALQAAPDPKRLKIGAPGEVTVQIGQIVDTHTGKAATLRDIVQAAARKPFVFLGENHATTAHQMMEGAIVAALVGAGRKVAVGMEMYQRPKQEWLDKWSANTMEEADFLEKSDWKKQWGFDFGFYRPVFQVVRDNGLPLIGLNVPRDWVRAVGRGGFASLPEESKGQLPRDMSLSVSGHRQVWNALMGESPHPMGGASMDNMYAAQVLWDEGMADTALRYRASHPSDVFVVIAGSGHVLYKQGINYRVTRRRGGDGVTVVMMQGDGPVTVSRGIGDFVYLTKEQPVPAK